MEQFVMLGLIVLIFYFFMIRPQMKQRKEQKNFRESLKNGDKVVTIGGIHGKILEVTDTNVLLAVDNGKLRVEKNSISYNSDDQLSEVKK